MKDSVSNKLYSAFDILRGMFNGIVGILIVHLVLSCSASDAGKLSPLKESFTRPVSWFDSQSGRYLFNTSIDAIGNHYSGITVVKPMDKGNYRTVMMTETGLKIFDMEFFPDSVRVIHYIMEPLNRKILIKVLTRDISLILMNYGSKENHPCFRSEGDNGSRVVVCKSGREKYYYVMKPENPKPDQVRLLKGRKVKVSVDYFGNPESGADSIKLSHKNIDLSIGLFRIPE